MAEAAKRKRAETSNKKRMDAVLKRVPVQLQRQFFDFGVKANVYCKGLEKLWMMQGGEEDQARWNDEKKAFYAQLHPQQDALYSAITDWLDCSIPVNMRVLDPDSVFSLFDSWFKMKYTVTQERAMEGLIDFEKRCLLIYKQWPDMMRRVIRTVSDCRNLEQSQKKEALDDIVNRLLRLCGDIASRTMSQRLHAMINSADKRDHDFLVLIHDRFAAAVAQLRAEGGKK